MDTALNNPSPNLLNETIDMLNQLNNSPITGNILQVDATGQLVVSLHGFQVNGNLNYKNDITNILSFIGLHKDWLERERQLIDEQSDCVNVLDVRQIPLTKLEDILNNYQFKKASIQ